MTKKYLATLVLPFLISEIVFGQSDYDKFIQALISGDTILAKQIEDRNVTIEPIEEKIFPAKNISEHIFNLGVCQIKDSIIAFFNFENQFNNKILTPIFWNWMSGDDSSEENRHSIFFYAETVKDSIFSTSYFRRPNTSNDIYIHAFAEAWPSKLYFSKGKPLDYRTAFIIKLYPQDINSTKVSIVAQSPTVYNGITGFGFHAPIARETKVQPSSIEEYSLLLFIADKLKDKSLVPLKLPINK